MMHQLRRRHDASSYSKSQKAGKEQGWIDSNKTLVAAVSGGGDSVALLDALAETYNGRSSSLTSSMEFEGFHRLMTRIS